MATPQAHLAGIVTDELERVPPDVYAAPSMLSYPERALLHWAARTASEGEIVDAGCFLGGSTLSLSRGLAAREESDDTSVHSYDLFTFAGEWEGHWVPEGMPFEVGGSSRPVFDHTIREIAERVQVHAGDILTEGWSGAPVSVLFLDVLKSWEISDHVHRAFLPHLVPGESMVVQQDQVHWGHPWCAITMELLADRFEFLGWVSYSSAVYRCTKAIAPVDVPASLLRDLSLDEQLDMLAAFADRLSPSAAAPVRLSAAVVLASHGEVDRARALVDRTGAAIAAGEEAPQHLSEGIVYLGAWIDQVEVGSIGGDDSHLRL